MEGNPRPRRRLTSSLTVVALLVVPAVVFVLAVVAFNSSSPRPRAANNHHQRRRLEQETTTTTTTTVTVYSHRSSETTSLIARKQWHDLEQQVVGTDRVNFVSIPLTEEEQHDFVRQTCGQPAATRLAEFRKQQQEFMAIEVFKWCALQQQQGQPAMFLDSTTPLLTRLHDTVQDAHRSLVVVLPDGAITTGMILLQPAHASVAREMLSLLISTPVSTLIIQPLFLPVALTDKVAKRLPNQGQKEVVLQPGTYAEWKILQQSCPDSAGQVPYQCPASDTKLCCSIVDTTEQTTIALSPYPVLPVWRLQPESLPVPYSSLGDKNNNKETSNANMDELPFISTVREEATGESKDQTILSFYEKLPSGCFTVPCAKCVRDKKGASCKSCAHVCECYCKLLCRDMPKSRPVTKNIHVHPPVFKRDPQRLIPRIIHQTWFEDLNSTQYPNMSRLVESFKRSGWDYRFYTDAEASQFLQTHFPSEVKEAYDTLRPGAFKADLFRYCALLIHGGVYADVDLLLESNLDYSVPPDIGFMVPVDEPGKPVKRQMCLWNGFIAAAPAHPVLAKAIETVVNQVRNRFTSIDVDATFCPNPELSMLHAYDTLFTAGPCLLGATLNRVWGRHGQESFAPGELSHNDDFSSRQRTMQATDFVVGGTSDPIPGRVVILKQDKWDMGAHRFTLLEKNLVVSATDLPDSNDRENLEDSGPEHYSKTHATTGVYGLEHLYVDAVKAHEDVRIFVHINDNEGQSKI